MATIGQKHLIKCRCILPQLRNTKDPEKSQHKFLVFSIIEDDVVIPKFAQCNNCGLIHKVIDICTSEIVQGKEGMSSILSIEDIKAGMNANLSSILDRHQCDLPTWEHAQFIMDNKRWGDVIVITNDLEENNRIVKYVRVLGETLFKVDSHSRKETF